MAGTVVPFVGADINSIPLDAVVLEDQHANLACVPTILNIRVNVELLTPVGSEIFKSPVIVPPLNRKYLPSLSVLL